MASLPLDEISLGIGKLAHFDISMVAFHPFCNLTRAPAKSCAQVLQVQSPLAVNEKLNAVDG